MRRSRIVWAAGVGAVLVLAVVFATAVQVFMPPAWGAGVGWSRTVVYNLAHFALWAALAPGLWWLARRLPLDGGAWRWTLVIQVAASCVVAVAQLAGAELVLSPFVTARDAVRPDLIDAMRFSLAVNFQAAVMTYWAICGAAYAYFFYRREVAAVAMAADARFRTLESHVAPHFLFNALNSVTSLVDFDPEAAKRLIARLGDLLRDSLVARELATMTVDEELAVVNRYLDIEQARFADRLAFAVEADAEARRCQVPSFLLQPLVENAIRHGLQRSREPVRIAIHARRRAARLVLEVLDDGRPGDATPPREGLGLQRTKARLDQFYGAAHAFEAGPLADRGFRVAIEIPASEVRA